MNRSALRIAGIVLGAAAVGLLPAAPPVAAGNFWDPPGTDDPCGDPLIECFGSSTMSNADAVGNALGRQVETGDCGGSPEGCLGLLLFNLMCAIDGRELTQLACGPGQDPPAGDPPAGDPPAEDPPAGDPPAGDPPAGDPPAEDPLVVADSSRLNGAVRRYLSGEQLASIVYRLRIGEGSQSVGFVFRLDGRFEHTKKRSEYYATLTARDIRTGDEFEIILGGEVYEGLDLVYATGAEWFWGRIPDGVSP